MPISTGSEYIERLRDDREVYFAGEQIDDVTTHPATREMIRTQAELFDLQHDPEYQDRLTYQSPTTGDLVPIFYKLPRTREALEARRNASKIFHEYTCGFGGRASDFLASGMAGLAISADVFDADGHEYGDNVWEYYEHCRENDLCLTHAIIDPQIDRSSTGGSSFRLEGEAGHRPGALRMVEDSEDGMLVSGARMLATLGPQADEVLIFPFGHHGEDDADEAIAFALPIDADGLRMICRPSLSANDRRNHPLSSRMDEMDVFMVLDEVFVPEDRIFVKGNPDVANDWRHTAQPEYATHQTLTKDLAKMEFILGVALLLAESTGIDEYFHVQAKLGEIAQTVQHVESGLWAMEAKAEAYGDTGYLVPDYVAGNATVGHFADLYRRCIDILQDLGGSGLVGIPAYEDLEDGEPLASDVEAYFRGKEMEARERLGVQKLANEIAISGFGGREELYERFHVGGPMRVKSNLYKGYPDKDALKEHARTYGLAGADEPPDSS